ncbi:MAG TPA: glutamate--tRNA ligase [Candidatus Nanoarchaeia archaeon]|nr:glutamate--tRNA ligase [Candidatus Nanoarchaeia archaeon]
MKDFSNEIRAQALRNALAFGKADAGRLLPKLFSYGLDKKDISKVMPVIQEIVREVNGLSAQEKEQQFKRLEELIPEKIEKEKELPELVGAMKGKVITRIPPEPSKYLHIGHALSFLINYLEAERYGGKCLLRFEDANPEKCSQEYVDAIRADLKEYLEIKTAGVRFVSDDMELFYDAAEKLIAKGAAYMCFCSQEDMREKRHTGKECSCRKESVQKTQELWKSFVSGKFDEGKAVLRLKGDMAALNHTLRDPVLFRVSKTPHFRLKKKYCVWPVYDFYNPIEDSEMGVTHILRSAEFEQRAPLHDRLRELLGLKKPEIMEYGRFGVIDASTKGREVREGIEKGEYLGWDDPRLVTLKALRRRGISRDVLVALAKQLSLSKKEVQIDFAMVAAMSRKLVDAETERYYFVADSIELEVSGAPKIQEVQIPVHPDSKKMRSVHVGKSIFIPEKDFEGERGKEIRLLHLYNVQLSAKGKKAVYTSSENKQLPRIQWVSEGVDVEIMMDDASIVSGVGEQAIADLKLGAVVQFERFGFVRLDAVIKKGKEKVYSFWFSHH